MSQITKITSTCAVVVKKVVGKPWFHWLPQTKEKKSTLKVRL